MSGGNPQLEDPLSLSVFNTAVPNIGAQCYQVRTKSDSWAEIMMMKHSELFTKPYSESCD